MDNQNARMPEEGSGDKKADKKQAGKTGLYSACIILMIINKTGRKSEETGRKAKAETGKSRGVSGRNRKGSRK